MSSIVPVVVKMNDLATIAAVKACVAAGVEIRKINKSLTDLFTPEVREAVRHLKDDCFQVHKGCAGITCKFEADDLGIPNQCLPKSWLGDWAGFCYGVFGCTPRRINQLLDLEDQEKRQERDAKRRKAAARLPKGYELRGNQEFPIGAVTQTVVEINGDESDVYQEEADCGEDNEPEIQDGEANDVVQQLEQTLTAVGANPKYDSKDAYGYFSEFKDEPHTLGTEISGMLLDFGLDLAAIKKVLRAAEKDATKTLCQVKEAAA
ncbi:MAG: hypothetical protein ACLPTQ_08265 [Terriglobales bacterium]